MEVPFHMEITEANGEKIALYQSDSPMITSEETALDLLAQAAFELGIRRIVLNKEALCEDFFRLGTGLAGKILEKFIQYQVKLAIVGDFSGYTSKPLRDFIYESNQGRDIFFVEKREEAIRRLSQAR